MSGARNKRKKLQLFGLQNGLCYWCGKPMELTLQHFRHHRDTHATLEHLDDRFSEERGRHGGERRVVLACLRCNNERGRTNQSAQPKEELWRRSGRTPDAAIAEAEPR